MSRLQRLLPPLLCVVLCLVTVGVIVVNREFVKIKIGPFYLLEVLAAICGMLVILMGKKAIPRRAIIRQLLPAIAYALYGLVLLQIYFLRSPVSLSMVPMARILQHSILFVYPLEWMTIGYYAYALDAQKAPWIAYCSLINAWPSVLGHSTPNISVGPILVIPFMLLLYQFIIDGGSESIWKCLLIGLLGVFTFYPFWVMSLDTFQRTSLLILVFNIMAVPWFLSRGSGLIWNPIKTSAIALLIFIVGSGAFVGAHLAPKLNLRKFHARVSSNQSSSAPSYPAPLQQKQSASPPAASTSVPKPKVMSPTISVKKKITYLVAKPFSHGEDGLQDGHLVPQMAVRRFFWHSALVQWHEHPVVGIGFIPEVPEYVSPSRKNTGGFVAGNTPAISGPHNSYLSILTRTGVIGLVLFAWLMIEWALQAMTLFPSRTFPLLDLLLLLVPANGAIHAFFNVGFESPHNCILMWLLGGLALARAQSLSREH